MALSSALCSRIVESLDQEILLIGPGGRIVFANRRAREFAGITEGDETVRIGDLVKDGAGSLSTQLSFIAQTTQWAPVNIHLESGPMAGLTLKFRGRGTLEEGDTEPLLLLVGDRNRDAGFSELRQLIKELNSQLAQKQRDNVALEASLASEERLHGELVHRVKNNLALLSALIHFRSNDSNDPQVREALTDLDHASMRSAPCTISSIVRARSITCRRAS